MQATSKRNARFWAFINCGWVKITLRPDQSLSWFSGGPTDEGYCYEVTTWELEDGVLSEQWVQTARDCDGPSDTHYTCSCPVDRLSIIEPYAMEGTPALPFLTPDWVNESRGQRDHYAEAMNY